jgi:hypothetical protein
MGYLAKDEVPITNHTTVTLKPILIPLQVARLLGLAIQRMTVPR